MIFKPRVGWLIGQIQPGQVSLDLCGTLLTSNLYGDTLHRIPRVCMTKNLKFERKLLMGIFWPVVVALICAIFTAGCDSAGTTNPRGDEISTTQAQSVSPTATPTVRPTELPTASPTATPVATPAAGPTESPDASQEAAAQNEAALPPPPAVAGLCANAGEQEFVTQEGQAQKFRGRALFIQRCDNGSVWRVSENGAEVPDAATFFFDNNGVLLDICQPMFWPSGCTRFEAVTCEPENYCKKE